MSLLLHERPHWCSNCWWNKSAVVSQHVYSYLTTTTTGSHMFGQSFSHTYECFSDFIADVYHILSCVLPFDEAPPSPRSSASEEIQRAFIHQKSYVTLRPVTGISSGKRCSKVNVKLNNFVTQPSRVTSTLPLLFHVNSFWSQRSLIPVMQMSFLLLWRWLTCYATIFFSCITFQILPAFLCVIPKQ